MNSLIEDILTVFDEIENAEQALLQALDDKEKSILKEVEETPQPLLATHLR
jgi:molecular chaperone GrpE (heat shock protein)